MRQGLGDDNPTRDIGVKCPQENWSRPIQRRYTRYDWDGSIIPRVKEILKDCRKQGFKPTIRQVFYRLVSERRLPNTQKAYKRLVQKLTEEREYGLEALKYRNSPDEEIDFGIDPDAFADTSRRILGGDQGFLSVEEYFQKMFSIFEAGYTRRRWIEQPKQVVLWLEKEALTGVLEDIAKKYHVKLIPTRGYASFTIVFNHLIAGIDPSKPLVILMLTDFDPSGEDMVRDLKERVEEYTFWFYHARKMRSPTIIVKKVALTREQVIKYNLPPNPAKITDPRYVWFSKAYGDVATELDALPPKVLRQLVENAIIENIDVGAWKEVQYKEKEEKERIKEIVQKLREMLESELS